MFELAEIAVLDELMDARVLDHLVEAQLHAIGPVGRGSQAENPLGPDEIMEMGTRTGRIMLCLVDDQQVNVGRRSLVEHADRLQVHTDLVPFVFAADLFQEIPPHRDPADPGARTELQGLGNYEPHARFATASGRLDHDGASGWLDLARAVAVVTREHVQGLANDAGLVGTRFDAGLLEDFANEGFGTHAVPCGVPVTNVCPHVWQEAAARKMPRQAVAVERAWGYAIGTEGISERNDCGKSASAGPLAPS